MALRNPETVARLLDRMTGSMKNLKLMVKSQQPVEEFIKKIESTEDIHRVTTTIDLCTMNSERLGSGHGDSEISLTFKCIVQQIQEFRSGLVNWLKSS